MKPKKERILSIEVMINHHKDKKDSITFFDWLFGFRSAMHCLFGPDSKEYATVQEYINEQIG